MLSVDLRSGDLGQPLSEGWHILGPDVDDEAGDVCLGGRWIDKPAR